MEFSTRMEPEGCKQNSMSDHNAILDYKWMSCEMEPDTPVMVYTQVPRILENQNCGHLTFGVSISNLNPDLNFEDNQCADMKYRYMDSVCEDSVYEDSNMTLIINDTRHEAIMFSDKRCYEDILCDNQCVPDDECELLTREVEGCEDPEPEPIVDNYVTSSRSSKQKRKSSFNPRASSTMIEDYPTRHKNIYRNSIPCASSTMIIEEEDDIPNTEGQPKEEEDLQSIFTWSIHDSYEDTSFEESFMKRHHLIVKPPAPKRRKVSCDSFCVTMETLTSHRESITDVESLYDDDICAKTEPMTTSQQVFQESDFQEVPSCSMGDDDVFYSLHERQEPAELIHHVSKPTKVSKFPKNTLTLRKLFKLMKSKGKNSDRICVDKQENFDKSTSDVACQKVRQQISEKTTGFITSQNRKAVMTNFKRFKANV